MPHSVTHPPTFFTECVILAQCQQTFSVCYLKFITCGQNFLFQSAILFYVRSILLCQTRNTYNKKFQKRKLDINNDIRLAPVAVHSKKNTITNSLTCVERYAITKLWNFSTVVETIQSFQYTELYWLKIHKENTNS